MRKISKKFDDIWQKAEEINVKGRRFERIYSFNKKYITMGIYDTVSKQYALFDTINLVGNFRYSPQEIPAELYHMEQIVKSAVK